MKLGSLVIYRAYPNLELREAGITGLVLSSPYQLTGASPGDNLPVVDVLWSETRSPAWGNSQITWDFVDELEVIG